MIFSYINFKNFKIKKKNSKLKTYLKLILKKKDEVVSSLGTDYKFSFDKKKIQRYKKFSNYRLIGMGGSSLGAQAIFDFLKIKIKKNFTFINNLETEQFKKQKLNKPVKKVLNSKPVEATKNTVGAGLSLTWTLICAGIVLFFVFPQCFT